MIKKLKNDDLIIVESELEKAKNKMVQIEKEIKEKTYDIFSIPQYLIMEQNHQEVIIQTIQEIKNAIIQDGEAWIESHEQKLLNIK